MNEQLPVKIPRIARPKARARIVPYALGIAVIGSGVFAGLASTRTAREEQAGTLPTLARSSAVTPAPAPILVTPPAPAAPLPVTIPTIVPPSRTAVTTIVVKPDGGETAAPKAAHTKDTAEKAKERLDSPALIVDLGPTPASFARGSRLPLINASFSDADPASTPPSSIPTVALPDPTGASIAAAGPAADANASADRATRDLNSNERFAARAGNRETEVAHAQRLPNQESLIVQGTLIAGVMETALNSDLPGNARAIVTRDVLSFDGSQVLIPAGSRVIGEYNSGVAQGASRIFIVWNRLIRPDGVSVSLGSPAVDELGRGGLGGKVNRHFIQRFGGAILLSVLGGGANLLTQSLNRNSTVIVSSNSEASSLGGGAARPTDIAPTITTPQGAQVQIFVARDLDFSGVGPLI